ncbi:hypothetical protein Tco_0866839 [Tanacetum coccineum]
MARCSDGKGRRYEKGGIVAIVEGEAHGALGLRGGLLGVQSQSHIVKIIISKLTYKLGGLLLLSSIGFRMEPQLGLYVRLGTRGFYSVWTTRFSTTKVLGVEVFRRQGAAGYRQVKVLEFFDCPGSRQGVDDLRELLVGYRDVEANDSIVEILGILFPGDYELQDLINTVELPMYKKLQKFDRPIATKSCAVNNEKFDPANANLMEHNKKRMARNHEILLGEDASEAQEWIVDGDDAHWEAIGDALGVEDE